MYLYIYVLSNNCSFAFLYIQAHTIASPSSISYICMFYMSEAALLHFSSSSQQLPPRLHVHKSVDTCALASCNINVSSTCIWPLNSQHYWHSERNCLQFSVVESTCFRNPPDIQEVYLWLASFAGNSFDTWDYTCVSRSRGFRIFTSRIHRASVRS